MITNWAEIEKQVFDAKFTVGAESTNVVTVQIQLLDRHGSNLSWRSAVPFYLAADANGDTIGAAPDGGIAISTNGLALEWTDNVSGMLISEANGLINLALTEAGALTSYLVLIMPNGQLKISSAITHAA